jgi:hypothetical protein
VPTAPPLPPSIASIEQRMTEMRRGHIVDWLVREAKSLSDDLLKLNPRFDQGDIDACSPSRGG